MLKPLFHHKHSLLWPHLNFKFSRSWLWLPSPKAWLQAFCLLPLAIPGFKIIVSGLAWFYWLKFPGSWLAASLIFIVMHLFIPVLVLGILHYVVKSLLLDSARAIRYQTWQFALSTLIIIVLSFLGTVGITNGLEAIGDQIFQSGQLTNAGLSSFSANSVRNFIFDLDTYHFPYYAWFVWLIVTAYLYQLEENMFFSPQKGV
jgi:hypothetical protein